MISKWTEVMLEDIAVLNGGYAFKSKDYVNAGHFVLRTVNINNDGRITKKGAVFVPLAFAELYKRFSLRPFDTLFVMVGATLGKIGLVTEKDLPALLNQNMWVVRTKRNDIDPLFLHYAFVFYSKPLCSLVSGSARGFVKRDDFRRMKLQIPPFEDQKKISLFLSALDEQITLMHEINSTLESTAQALFKSWFVDFDPVRSKQEGRRLKGLDEAINALFPDSFDQSEIGEIPKGWLINKVSSVAEIVKGKSYSSKDLVDKHPVALVTLKSFERGGGFRMDGFKPYSGPYKSSQIVMAGDLIVAYTDVTQAAELIGKPAIVVEVEEYETLVASLDVGIIRPNQACCGRQFLYGLFKTDSFKNHTFAYTSGTTVLHLAKEAIGSFSFALPPKKLLDFFEETTSAISERKQINSSKIKTLSRFRDILLPRIISGKLRLADAEKQIEAIA